MELIKRELTESEIERLIEEIKKFNGLIRISKENWKQYKEMYVVEEDGEMMGVCAIKRLGKWVKLGPACVLEKHQGKGCISMILEHFVEQDWNIYAGTLEPILQKKFTKLGFTKVSPWRVPIRVYLHHISNTIKYGDKTYFSELRKKKKLGLLKGPYYFYLRPFDK